LFFLSFGLSFGGKTYLKGKDNGKPLLKVSDLVNRVETFKETAKCNPPENPQPVGNTYQYENIIKYPRIPVIMKATGSYISLLISIKKR
jgi:hypothetical protein